jgi:hypothetical protein
MRILRQGFVAYVAALLLGHGHAYAENVESGIGVMIIYDAQKHEMEVKGVFPDDDVSNSSEILEMKKNNPNLNPRMMGLPPRPLTAADATTAVRDKAVQEREKRITVKPVSGARAAGIKKGDFIVGIDGKQLPNENATIGPLGSVIRVDLRAADGKTRSVNVVRAYSLLEYLWMDRDAKEKGVVAIMQTIHDGAVSRFIGFSSGNHNIERDLDQLPYSMIVDWANSEGYAAATAGDCGEPKALTMYLTAMRQLSANERSGFPGAGAKYDAKGKYEPVGQVAEKTNLKISICQKVGNEWKHKAPCGKRVKGEPPEPGKFCDRMLTQLYLSDRVDSGCDASYIASAINRQSELRENWEHLKNQAGDQAVTKAQESVKKVTNASESVPKIPKRPF